MKKLISSVGVFIFMVGEAISSTGMILISDLDHRRAVAKGMADVGKSAQSFLNTDALISSMEDVEKQLPK